MKQKKKAELNEDDTLQTKTGDDKVNQMPLIEILRHILKTEGLMSLYKGLKMALLGTVVSYGVYFWWYRFLKNKFALHLKRTNFSSLEMTLITALAGSMSSVFANPIWMLNTRLAIQKKESSGERLKAPQLAKSILEKEGIGAFFKGVIPNLILVINPIINYVVYEQLKSILSKKYKSENHIPFSAIFFMSSVGKILATFATYPILTVRVRLQADENSTGNIFS